MKHGETRLTNAVRGCVIAFTAACLLVLSGCAQAPAGSASSAESSAAVGPSFTQFSCIYRNAAKTVSVWPFQNWQASYTFNTSGEGLS